MRLDGGGDDEGVDVRVEQRPMIRKDLELRIVAAHVVATVGAGVGHGQKVDIRHFPKISNDLRTPVAAAHHPDPKTPVFGCGAVWMGGLHAHSGRTAGRPLVASVTPFETTSGEGCPREKVSASATQSCTPRAWVVVSSRIVAVLPDNGYFCQAPAPGRSTEYQQ